MIISQKWVLHKKPNGFNKMLENEGMYWKLFQNEAMGLKKEGMYWKSVRIGRHKKPFKTLEVGENTIVASGHKWHSMSVLMTLPRSNNNRIRIE